LRRNCLLKQVIEGKIKGGIEVTGRRGRRRRKLLDDLKERRMHICVCIYIYIIIIIYLEIYIDESGF